MKLILNIRADNYILDIINGVPINNNAGVSYGEPDMFGGNNAMYFNGTNYLNIISDLINFGTADFTVTFWANLKPNENTNWNGFFGNYTPNSIVFWAYGRGGADYSLSIGTSDYNRTDGIIIDGIWHYYTIMRQKDIIYFYFDGKLKTTFTMPANIPINFGGNLGIGWELHYNKIKGYMSDFAIADSCLWDGEFIVPTRYLHSTKNLYIDIENKSVWGCINV